MNIEIIKIEENKSGEFGGEKTLTLKREDGKIFAVNVPEESWQTEGEYRHPCLLYTSPSPRD